MPFSEEIAWIAAPPPYRGALGFAAFPGLAISPRGERVVDRGRQRRVLDALRARSAACLVLTTTAREIPPGEAAHLRRAAAARGLGVVRFAIADFSVPGPAGRRAWLDLSPRLLAAMRGGDAVAFSCLAGLGRSGMMAARLLIDAGLAPAAAIDAVRAAKPEAIESERQISFLLSSAREASPRP